MSTNLENREKKNTEKEKVRWQASEAQREEELERDRKNKEEFFLLEEQHDILQRRWENAKY